MPRPCNCSSRSPTSSPRSTTHHPIAVSQYYEDQAGRQAARRRLPAKAAAQVPRLLRARPARSGGPWLLGDACCHADLSVLQALLGLAYAFPRAFARPAPPRRSCSACATASPPARGSPPTWPRRGGRRSTSTASSATTPSSTPPEANRIGEAEPRPRGPCRRWTPSPSIAALTPSRATPRGQRTRPGSAPRRTSRRPRSTHFFRRALHLGLGLTTRHLAHATLNCPRSRRRCEPALVAEATPSCCAIISSRLAPPRPPRSRRSADESTSPDTPSPPPSPSDTAPRARRTGCSPRCTPRSLPEGICRAAHRGAVIGADAAGNVAAGGLAGSRRHRLLPLVIVSGVEVIASTVVVGSLAPTVESGLPRRSRSPRRSGRRAAHRSRYRSSRARRRRTTELSTWCHRYESAYFMPSILAVGGRELAPTVHSPSDRTSRHDLARAELPAMRPRPACTSVIRANGPGGATRRRPRSAHR